MQVCIVHYQCSHYIYKTSGIKIIPRATDCADGDVRLTSVEKATPGTVEGTLEVCFNNIWGLISESSWTTKDAKVACKQLGYIGEGV